MTAAAGRCPCANVDPLFRWAQKYSAVLMVAQIHDVAITREPALNGAGAGAPPPMAIVQARGGKGVGGFYDEALLQIFYQQSLAPGHYFLRCGPVQWPSAAPPSGCVNFFFKCLWAARPSPPLLS